MEILVWFYHLTVPLLGWWLLISQIQKFSLRLEDSSNWGEHFPKSLIRSFFVSLFHGTPEFHMQRAQAVQLPERLRLLWLGLRSLSYGFIFLIVFGVIAFVPVPVALLLGLCLFVAFQWWKSLWNVALFVLGAGLFLYGFENLLQASARFMGDGEAAGWVYELGNNYLPGAIMGFGIGAVLRGIFRVSGVALWSGSNLLLAGILSLGGAWGFFLGDFIVGAVEDCLRFQNKEARWRCFISIGLALVGLLLSGPYQSFFMDWMNGQYSAPLRSLQWAIMIFVFLFLESAVALGFFHFYHFRKRND